MKKGRVGINRKRRRSVESGKTKIKYFMGTAEKRGVFVEIAVTRDNLRQVNYGTMGEMSLNVPARSCCE